MLAHSHVLGAMLGLALGVTSASWGQTPGSGVRIYEMEFFKNFNVQTAFEVVQQVPGFTFEDSDQFQRGFTGSSGNVLLNQRRPRGKSDNLSAIPRNFCSSAETFNAFLVPILSGSSSSAAGHLGIRLLVKRWL